jgi:hypothetical protein
MPPAKLFSGLALAFSICAGLALLFSSPDINGPHLAFGRGVYFALGPALVPLFGAVASLNFAVLYYAAVRIFDAQWNRTLTFLHFALSVCFGVCGSLIYPMAAHYGNGAHAGGASVRWVFLPLLLGILSFIASYVIFGISLVSIAVQIVRARFASR